MGRTTLELKGFDEFYAKLERMGADADAVAEKTFDECLDILESELKTKAQKSGVPASLTSKITKNKVSGHGVFYGSVGWKSQKAKPAPELSDFHKVVFLNYGTPTRKTKKGYNRGYIVKRGFIKRAKNSAKRRTKALMKSKIHEILGD